MHIISGAKTHLHIASACTSSIHQRNANLCLSCKTASGPITLCCTLSVTVDRAVVEGHVVHVVLWCKAIYGLAPTAWHDWDVVILQDDCAITPVISESSANFIEGLVKDAEEKGATLCQKYKRENNLIWPVLIDHVNAVGSFYPSSPELAPLQQHPNIHCDDLWLQCIPDLALSILLLYENGRGT